MQQRMDYRKAAPQGIAALRSLQAYVDACGLERSLVELVKTRASQINGCAFCLDMHWKEARAAGETEQRLYGLDAWREGPWYTDRERAALAWCEALTRVTEGHVPDEVFQAVRPHFSDRELADLSLTVVAINGWNRIVIASRREAGTHVPAPRRADGATAAPGA